MARQAYCSGSLVKISTLEHGLIKLWSCSLCPPPPANTHTIHVNSQRRQQAMGRPFVHLSHEGDAVEVEGLGALLRRPEFHEGVLVVDAAGHHRVAGSGGEVNLKAKGVWCVARHGVPGAKTGEGGRETRMRFCQQRYPKRREALRSGKG